MSKLALRASFASLPLLLLAGVAAAQEPPSGPPPGAGSPPVSGMGAPGTISLQGDFNIRFNRLSESNPGPGGDPDATVTIAIVPSGDYFVAPNISVGGAIGFIRTSVGDTSATTLGIGPRVGYLAHLAPRVSLWPRAGLAYNHISTSVPGLDQSGYAITLDVTALLLYHLTDHFFIGGGPALDYDLISKLEGEDAAKQTDLGLVSVVGGWF
jgi:hypothetical protein